MRTSVAVAAGLVAAASAKTYSVTVTDDVTITSCGPTVTNCPYAAPTEGGAWDDWTSTTTTTKPVAPVSTSSDPAWADWTSTTTTSKPVSPISTTSSSEGAWGDWTTITSSSVPVSPVSTSSAACPSYTATTPPAWFSLLPTEVLSSISAAWTGAPPADWCYYTYSTSSVATSPVAPTSIPVAPISTKTGSPYWPAGPTSETPVAPASTGTGVWSYTPSSPVSPATFTGAASANAGSFAFAGLVAAAAVVMA
ncbi:uncharacterized protein PV06_03281 [Exophiala oligosperma]|uniref:Uncharacterized protein n=2 Tax=Chaetothyriales TaxID=34395 RepID=A0A0D2DPS9_9EURO|nr:uncharacterized protein PV06_03281 [Exophiala oligosperma]KAJ9642148.1 hypothetical protein H2204_002517 [Knufia peltigerae]KIW44838.1 hypothetical protein PV06_03281 [Exophiala oligosperma]